MAADRPGRVQAGIDPESVREVASPAEQYGTCEPHAVPVPSQRPASVYGEDGFRKRDRLGGAGD